MKDNKTQISKEQSERVGTCSYSNERCPECGGQVWDMPPDFCSDEYLKSCSKCDWKNFEVIDEKPVKDMCQLRALKDQ